MGPKAARRTRSGKTLEPGMQVGPYRIEGLLGRGGMGHVFRASVMGERGRSPEVALKHIELDDATSLARFERESKLASMLTHPNVCRVYDFFHDQGDAYLAMELVNGTSLEEFLSAHRAQKAVIHPKLALYVVREVAKALDYASKRLDPDTGLPMNLIHRDVTPANILLSRDGHVKLIDFGIARRPKDQSFTGSNTVHGTVRFLAPEQVLGRKIDTRVDVYALSMVLAELLLGYAPLAKLAPVELLQRLRDGEALNFRPLLRNVPEPLLRVLERGTAPDRDWRFESAGELLRALEEVVRETGWKASASDLRSAIRGRSATGPLGAARLFVRRWAVPIALGGLLILGFLLLRRPF